MKRKGFTIVELLMVVGIISVLIGITVSAISGSMKRARIRRAEALCTLVEQGIATYYAQKDEWPFSVLNKEEVQLNADENGDKDTGKPQVMFRLDDDKDVQPGFLKIVEQTQDGSPVMDVAGLFVAKKGGTLKNKSGMDFMSAVRGTKDETRGIKLADMIFGYPDPNTGKFRKFKITYLPELDKVTVSLQN